MASAADYYRVQRTSFDPGMGLDEICDALNAGLYIASLAPAAQVLTSAQISHIASGTAELLAAGTVAGKLSQTISVVDEPFGAPIDGTTDASAEIQEAIDALEAGGGGNIHFPRKRFNIGTTGIVIPPTVSVSAERGAELLYTGTGIALTIEGSTDTMGRHMVLPSVIRTTASEPLWNSGTDTTSIGVEVIDCKYDTIFFPAVKRFYIGILLTNSALNTVCNTFQLGLIRNNQVGIKFDPTGAFGCNQNTFIGGAVVIDAAYTSTSGRKYLEMLEAESNGNTFVGVNLEGTAAVEQIIDCSSRENVWLNCRFESAPSSSIRFNSGANANKIIGGDGTSTVTGGRWDSRVSDSGDGNLYMWGAVISGDAFTLNTKDTTGVLKFGNQTTAPSVPLAAFGTDRLRIGDSNTTGVRHFGAVHQEEKIVTSSAAPTLDANFVQLNYASPTTLTGAGGNGAPTAADVSAHLVLFDLNGNITLTHTASPAAGDKKFVLASGVDKVMRALTPYTFVSFNGNWYEVADRLQGSATFNPADLADGAGETTTVTVTGAALGDFAEASFSLDLQGITVTAWVSAADTVSVRFQNETTGNVNLGSGTLRARVRKAT